MAVVTVETTGKKKLALRMKNPDLLEQQVGIVIQLWGKAQGARCLFSLVSRPLQPRRRR